MRLIFPLFFIITAAPTTLAGVAHRTHTCQKNRCKKRFRPQRRTTKQCAHLGPHASDCNIKEVFIESDRCMHECMYPQCRKACLKDIGSATCAAERRPEYVPMPGSETCSHHIISDAITCDINCYVEFLQEPNCTDLCSRLEYIVNQTCTLLDLPGAARQNYRDKFVGDCHPTCLEEFLTHT